MITIITLYIETDNILQDMPIYDLQRALQNHPGAEPYLLHCLSLALSQFMGQSTGRAWDYHVRLITINYTIPETPASTPDHSFTGASSATNSQVKEPAMYYLHAMQTGTGKYLTVVNGKTYNLIRAYSAPRCNGTFFFIASGVTPLKAEDIEEQWIVTRYNNIYIARAARYFSYHLLKGTDTPCPVDGWPKFKALPDYFAFVGPDKTAVEAQIASVIRQFVPSKTELIPYLIADANSVFEQVTKDEPKAYIIATEELR